MRAPIHTLTDEDRRARARVLDGLPPYDDLQTAREGAAGGSSPVYDQGPVDAEKEPLQAAPTPPTREEILAIEDKDVLAQIIGSHGGSVDRRKSPATLAAEAAEIVHGPE